MATITARKEASHRLGTPCRRESFTQMPIPVKKNEEHAYQRSPVIVVSTGALLRRAPRPHGLESRSHVDLLAGSSLRGFLCHAESRC
jgi:hypothetical protein